MYGHRISSPEPSAVARIMTLAPMYLRRFWGSGRSRYSTAGRTLLLGSSLASSLDRCVVSAIAILLLAPQFCPFCTRTHIIEMSALCQYIASATSWLARMLVTTRAVPCATDRTGKGYGENNTFSWPLGRRMTRLTAFRSGLGWRADTRTITVAGPAVPRRGSTYPYH